MKSYTESTFPLLPTLSAKFKFRKSFKNVILLLQGFCALSLSSSPSLSLPPSPSPRAPFFPPPPLSFSLSFSFSFSISFSPLCFLKFLLGLKNLNIFKSHCSYKVSYTVSVFCQGMYSWFFLKSMECSLYCFKYLCNCFIISSTGNF